MCRRRVLEVWKDKRGVAATYGLLLQCLVQGNDAHTARRLCELIAKRDDIDGWY